jgi:NTP pyrophosphatase (non-canonical NTP hydrolase)
MIAQVERYFPGILTEEEERKLRLFLQANLEYIKDQLLKEESVITWSFAPGIDRTPAYAIKFIFRQSAISVLYEDQLQEKYGSLILSLLKDQVLDLLAVFGFSRQERISCDKKMSRERSTVKLAFNDTWTPCEKPEYRITALPDLNDLRFKIVGWAQDKGIFEKATPQTQLLKAMEEMGELAKFLLKDDQHEVMDAIGDIVVCLTNLAHMRGTTLNECVQQAYDVISKRKGKMVNGAFVKEEK